MCAPNLEFQRVNPTTQVALFSVCVGTCLSIENITWKIYQGNFNSTSRVVQWTVFNQTNIWFYGLNTNNFTAINSLFLNNPQIEYWRFEVIYSFTSESSSSSISFVLNQPPCNGTCSISPRNGTTSTLFNISCPNWFDPDGIKDYSILTWTTDRSKLSMIAFASMSSFQIRLPVGNPVNLIVHIQDTYDSVTEYNLTSPIVVPDTVGINNLIQNIQVQTNAINNDPIVQLLSTGNQNIVGQVLTSLSQVFNQMNTENFDNAVSSKYH